jgi:hypothetical protein
MSTTDVAPAAASAPTVTPAVPTAAFTLGGRAYTITFDLQHLLRIEEAAGVPLMVLAEQHLDQLAVRDEKGEPVREPTQEQSGARFKQVPASRMRALVAACVPMPVDEVPMAGLGTAFMSLASALSQAVGQVMGARDDREDEDQVKPRPTGASGS